jgi:hypothetical protein
MALAQPKIVVQEVCEEFVQRATHCQAAGGGVDARAMAIDGDSPKVHAMPGHGRIALSSGLLALIIVLLSQKIAALAYCVPLVLHCDIEQPALELNRAPPADQSQSLATVLPTPATALVSCRTYLQQFQSAAGCVPPRCINLSAASAYEQ